MKAKKCLERDASFCFVFPFIVLSSMHVAFVIHGSILIGLFVFAYRANEKKHLILVAKTTVGVILLITLSSALGRW